MLETAFRMNFSPNKTTLKELALQTGLDENRVKHWFADKRHQLRKLKGDEHNSFLSVYLNIYVDNRYTNYQQVYTCVLLWENSMN